MNELEFTDQSEISTIRVGVKMESQYLFNISKTVDSNTIIL